MIDYGPAPNVRARWNAARLRLSIREGIESVKAGMAFFRMTRKPRRLIDCTPTQKMIALAIRQAHGE